MEGTIQKEAKKEAKKETTQSLEEYFAPFRENTIGQNQVFQTPYGQKRILYADWIASGRLYQPIEDLLNNEIAPFVGNTHTETTVTGCTMTLAYHKAKDMIKNYVGAGHDDILISSNSGMTGVVNKFQRILGLKIHEKYKDLVKLPKELRPIVFISHMEHHSNQTSWLETICDVQIIRPCGEGMMDCNHLKELLYEYRRRKVKIAAITSCSNVTGIKTPYYEVAELMHQNGGYCFVDFACSAPYIDINMRPSNPMQHLDAIYFSPHKFLGGPGSTGVLIFDAKLYKNKIPDNPGGGTVDWTNPWGEHKYIDQIEAREDGGTPAFLQTIRTALSMQLKEQMGVENILKREKEMVDLMWDRMLEMPGLRMLASNVKDRIGALSFYVEGLHYNLGVKLLNDRYGIQVRGGCSCAGTYGHYLLEVSQDYSNNITSRINIGDLTNKPGWIRLSIHPIMTNEELEYILDAINQLCIHFGEWEKDYEYNPSTNEFIHKEEPDDDMALVNNWFGKELI